MHFNTIIRGNYEHVVRTINNINAHYLPYTYKGKKALLKVGARVTWPLEIVFAKEHLPIFIKSLPDSREKGYKTSAIQRTYMKLMRKALGAVEIPDVEITKTTQQIPLDLDGVAFHHIGIKEDEIQEDGTERI